MKNICRIVAISEFVKQDIMNNLDIGNTPVEVIYNGCNKYEGEVKAPASKPEHPFIFTIGTVLRKKNFHVLPCLLKNNDYELLIAGNISDYVQVIMEEAKQWNVSERVHFLGPLSESEKHWYLSNCEAFLFPSIAEGFGLPPIEAMQYGKPVFLSCHTCLPEIGGACAYYFNHDFDRNEMIKEFESGMRDYTDNRPVRETALKINAGRFDWDNSARRYADVYREILSEM